MDRDYANVLHSLVWAAALVIIVVAITAMTTHTEDLKTAAKVIMAQPVGVKK